MMPPKREFEQVKVDEWINGMITNVEYDMKYKFKTYEGPAVRITIKLEGYNQAKKTLWMSFSYSKKSNLFILFVEPLVEGAFEYMPFDLDQLKDLKVKLMFEQKGQYQNIALVRPIGSKILPAPIKETQEWDAIEPVDEVPF